ncbi:amino ABC transporter, permease, 3-TM region, His/Glu/Gln/Arg/opine family domain protein [Hydrogenophaga sp. RAC07]|uniref:amino acid ABC transporter permease n=1 Tax=Hydrogenophaga sp. RAC07 TaxID=1842537 RepID=UPI00083D794F|nr:amino acid ABC transporter permease [Hydrogenophaga sp. RAC07]AOF87600.1 amino ABC transporter, permease, 3-TM region, His/Glu/Gln/Arg/opine family domain protein [Hydrogenophaga sp. RAC07]
MDLTATFFNWPVFKGAFPLLLEGLGVTVLLGLVSIVSGLVSGLLMALLRLYGPLPLRMLARVYIDVFRSIPLLVLLVLVYYALPFVGVRFTSFTAAALALSMVSCAYTAEIFRAGIEAIPKGQFEAADAIGLSFFSSMRDVILPQAFRIVVPPLTSNCINVLKDTALASVVAMPDLLKQATQAQALAANPTPLIGAAVLYLILLLPLVRLVGYFETRHRASLR